MILGKEIKGVTKVKKNNYRPYNCSSKNVDDCPQTLSHTSFGRQLFGKPKSSA